MSGTIRVKGFIFIMFGLFKKKEKLPLVVSGEYDGSYEAIKQKILSAQLSFDHDGVAFIADKGVKKDSTDYLWFTIETTF